MAALSMTHVLRVVTEVREGVEHRGEEDTGCLLPARYARRQLLVLDEVVVHQFVDHVEIGLTDPAPHTTGGAAAVGVPRLGLVPEGAAGTLPYARSQSIDDATWNGRHLSTTLNRPHLRYMRRRCRRRDRGHVSLRRTRIRNPQRNGRPQRRGTNQRRSVGKCGPPGSCHPQRNSDPGVRQVLRSVARRQAGRQPVGRYRCPPHQPSA